MSCNKTNSNERIFAQQEHREINRLWKRAIDRMSTSRLNFQDEFEPVGQQNKQKAGEKPPVMTAPENIPSEAIQKKLLKGKSQAKMKSPLQKFDEIVTKELTSRKMLEDEGIAAFEDPKKWSTLQFSMADMGRSRVSPDKKLSRGVLYSMDKETFDTETSDTQNAALLDAIDKLAQAQAFCRFEAAVKAAEAATAVVPPEMAEEVAVACAKDYQFEIVDVINEKIPLLEERKPIEVIGYIGMTKLKDTVE